MVLIIATVFALIYALLAPLGEGLMDTSRWIAKVFSPADTEEFGKNLPLKQMLRVKQAAYMDGWLSNIPFFSTIAMVISVVLGFYYSWWGGIIMLFGSVLLGVIAKRLMGRPVSHYILLIHHKMQHREADYRKKNDFTRFGICVEANRDLVELLAIYGNSTIRPPSENELKVIPFGNKHFWLEQNS